jgi:hypothetical protein
MPGRHGNLGWRSLFIRRNGRPGPVVVAANDDDGRIALWTPAGGLHAQAPFHWRNRRLLEAVAAEARDVQAG